MAGRPYATNDASPMPACVRLNDEHNDHAMTSSDQTITVQDILDIVEGQVAPERVEIVRMALRNDPSLARHIERMVADRRGVHALVQAAQRSATPDLGLVAEAVMRAEREQLMEEVLPGRSRQAGGGGGGGEGGEGGRRRGGRLAAMIALALLLGGAIGGAAWMLNAGPRSERGPLALEHADRGAHNRKGGTFVAMSDEATPDKPPGLPTEFGAGIDFPAMRSALSPPPGVPARARPAGDPSYAPGRFATLPLGPTGVDITGWSEELRRSLVTEARTVPRSASAPAAAGVGAVESPRAGEQQRRMSPIEAARLAVEGRLRIVVGARDAVAYTNQARVYAAVGASSQVVAPPSRSEAGPIKFVVELRVRMDSELAGVQDAIAALTQRLGGEGFGPRADVRLTEAAGEQGVGPAGPSLLVDDVLWWTRPVTNWEWTIAVRAVVEIVSDPASSPADAR